MRIPDKHVVGGANLQFTLKKATLNGSIIVLNEL